MSKDFEVKDSGERMQFESGMIREPSGTREDFDLCFPEGIEYDDQIFVRFAKHMAKGAEKYSDRNWEKANSLEEMQRFKKSAWRHFVKWYLGMSDEDHLSGVLFNLMGAETVKTKLEKKKEERFILNVMERDMERDME